MEGFLGVLLLALCGICVSTETSFWPDRPTYWWRFNYTTDGECSPVPYCSLYEKPRSSMSVFNASYQHQQFFNQPKLISKMFAYDNMSMDSPLVSPVNVTLYYESLCPDCKQIFINQIHPAYKKLASTGILNLQFVPFGNAKEHKYGGKWYFDCQHGEAECLGNKIETCAVHYVIGKALVQFMYCLEYYTPTLVNAQYCASFHKLPWKRIHNCVIGAEGDVLQHKMAVKTKALNPTHTYVPWFTLNGLHSNAIQEGLSTNMLSYICYHYKGIRPVECY